MATRRDFIRLIGGATLAGVVTAQCKGWEFLTPPPAIDADTLLKSKGLEFLEIAGQKIFPVYSVSGGLACEQIFYIFRRRKVGVQVLGVKIGLESAFNDPANYARNAVLFGVREFDKHSTSIKDGDDMGSGLRYVA